MDLNLKELIQKCPKDVLVLLLAIVYIVPVIFLNIQYSTSVFEVCTFLIDHKDKYNIKLAVLASTQIFPDNPLIRDLAASQAILESNLLGQPSKLAMKYNNAF